MPKLATSAAKSAARSKLKPRTIKLIRRLVEEAIDKELERDRVPVRRVKATATPALLYGAGL